MAFQLGPLPGLRLEPADRLPDAFRLGGRLLGLLQPAGRIPAGRPVDLLQQEGGVGRDTQSVQEPGFLLEGGGQALPGPGPGHGPCDLGLGLDHFGVQGVDGGDVLGREGHRAVGVSGHGQFGGGPLQGQPGGLYLLLVVPGEGRCHQGGGGPGPFGTEAPHLAGVVGRPGRGVPPPGEGLLKGEDAWGGFHRHVHVLERPRPGPVAGQLQIGGPHHHGMDHLGGQPQVGRRFRGVVDPQRRLTPSRQGLRPAVALGRVEPPQDVQPGGEPVGGSARKLNL